jgi:hypothetical protein
MNGDAPVVISHARAFPVSARGRSYVVLVLSDIAIADDDYEVSTLESQSLGVPEDMHGVVLWINKATQQIDEGDVWHPALAEAADLPSGVVLNLTTFDESRLLGQITLPRQADQPLSFDVQVNIPIRALGVKPAPVRKPAVKPAPSPRPHAP